MKLFNATIESYRSKPGEVLAEGTAADIAEFVNSANNEWKVGECQPADIGGRFETPPEDWTPKRRYYINTPTDSRGGYATLADAVREYARVNESVIIEE